jgi:hypothetical protein
MGRLLLLRIELIDVPPDRGEVLAEDFFERRAIVHTTPFSSVTGALLKRFQVLRVAGP